MAALGLPESCLEDNRLHRAKPSTRQPDHRAATVLTAAVLVVGWLVGDLPRAAAQQGDWEAISREYQIKAAFLYNFGRYVQWPPGAFRDARAPFVIGVAGPSPITAELQRIARAKTIQQRSIQIRQVSDAMEAGECHILFFPRSVEPQHRARAIQQCLGKPVLLVGESQAFLTQGGTFSFVIEQNKVRVHIALKAARSQGLTISAKLAQVSRIVDD